MGWHWLLQWSSSPLPGLIATTMDRVVVWGVLGLVIALIAWREYTLPEIVSVHPAAKPIRER